MIITTILLSCIVVALFVVVVVLWFSVSSTVNLLRETIDRVNEVEAEHNTYTKLAKESIGRTQQLTIIYRKLLKKGLVE